MRIQTILLVLTILTVSCNTIKDDIIVNVEEQYDTIDGERQVVSQTLKTIRISDSLPIAILTKVSNYNNDSRLQHLTGLTKENGLHDYLLDSLYYDKLGNDTLKKSFVHIDNKWLLAQVSYKKFRSDNQVSYFMTERSLQKESYFKKEIFYSYNTEGSIITETEVECHLQTDCDSIFKKKYIYAPFGKLNSTVSYIWKNNEWTEFKMKNGS